MWAEVVDALGKRVASLATREAQGSGPHTLVVPALVPGRYTMRLTHVGSPMYRKLVVE